MNWDGLFGCVRFAIAPAIPSGHRPQNLRGGMGNRSTASGLS
ncbi:hypothetical protein [Acaryochloris marina]|uniref:Uncharacterized protein n=1 Tax=Acaryochloris marina (strain MBIC 11017) TaxID=329726 RepID=B0CA56_ACAM1|nr:hypothetical protein [Acaryochloris marina]ABW26643.1 hypothetical protein AM1_1620 [Acaryochloris marina MBIC11017]